MTPVHMVALDMDGVLLDRASDGSKHILPETIAALWRAHEAGIVIALATGRDRAFLDSCLREHRLGPGHAPFPDVILPLERDVYFLEGDVYVADRPWNDAIEREERNLLPRADEMVRRLLAGELGTFVADVPEAAGAEGASPSLTRVKVYVLDRTLVEEKGYLELGFPSPQVAETASRLLAQAFESEGIDLIPRRNGSGVGIRHVNANKGRTIVQCLPRFGLVPAQVLAVGDSENDRTMLDGSFGVQAATVANADPAMKELVTGVGGMIASAPCGKGVVEILDAVLSQR